VVLVGVLMMGMRLLFIVDVAAWRCRLCPLFGWRRPPPHTGRAVKKEHADKSTAYNMPVSFNNVSYLWNARVFCEQIAPTKPCIDLFSQLNACS
jgi:hypothetical protein